MEIILIWALSALGGMTLALAFIPYEYNTELSRKEDEEDRQQWLRDHPHYNTKTHEIEYHE